MANQFDIKLEEQSSQLTQIQLQSPHALLTENMNDAYRVVQGSVIVYLVPVKKGSIERRKRIAELNKGDIFPSYAYRNEAFDVWKFLVVPKSGEAELELLENGSTKPLKRNFIHKCGIPKLEEEGFERCLEEFYLGQSLKDEGFIVHSEIAKKVVSGQTAATIISIAESAEEAPVQGSNTYRVIAQGCKAVGIEVASEARILSCCGAKMAVPDVARISNFTCREVVLEQKWYRQECGVLLGTLDDALVALYRKKGKSYVLYDGEKEVPITAEIAEKISPKAHSIGRALPRTRLTGKDLLRFCKKSIPKKSIVALALLGLAGTLIGILLPTLNQKIYDEYIALGDFGMVIQLCVLIGSFMLGNVFFSMVKKLTEYGVSCHVNYDLQNAVYWRIFQLPESFFRSYDSGDLAQRLGQAGSSGAQVVSQVTGAGFGMVFSLFYLWRMIKYSGKLTVWALIMSLVFALLSYFLETRSLRYETLQADTSGKAVAKLYQYLGGVDKIRMAGAEERAILEYLIPFTQEQKYEIQGKRITAVSEVLSDVSTYLFSMILYFVIIKKNQDISVGNFMAFNSAFGTFSSALMQLISGCMTIFRLKPIYTRLKPIFDTQPEDDEQKQIVQSLSGSIELEHVSFGYSPEAGNVLNDISLQIHPGEYVAIVGPSGCGKSTLLKLLLGFETPTQGKIRYDGKSLSGLDAHSLRRNLGVVLQDGKLIAGSIYDNITITCPNPTMKAVNEVIEAVGLKADIDQMPMGVQTVLSESGNTISGGQQQRILIARAIMNKPQVLFFDEATSALDNLTQAKVCQSLDDMHVTRVVIAHRLSTIQNCDRILVFNNGQIQEEGNFEKGIFTCFPAANGASSTDTSCCPRFSIKISPSDTVTTGPGSCCPGVSTS